VTATRDSIVGSCAATIGIFLTDGSCVTTIMSFVATVISFYPFNKVVDDDAMSHMEQGW
jgi:hypothetical protein